MAQAQNGQFDVFISYAWADGKDHAVRIQQELENADFRVWRDPNIRKSADFTAEIEIAMRASKLVVVVMTHRIQDKAENYVRREVAYAEILKKPILVARFDDAIILPLTTRTWLEFWNSEWEAQFPRLVDALHDEIKLVDAGTYQPPELPAELQNDPYRKYAQESYELAVSYIEQTTIFKQEIDLIARPDLERVGKKSMPHNSSLQQAFKRIGKALAEKPDLTSLSQAMTEYEGRVLLLGEPGAGKTTSLMALTRDLASARMGNPDEPLPIFAFCSGWKASPPQPIYEWLGTANDIPADEMKRMIEADEVVLVLDGLDELGSSQTEKDKNGQEISFDPRKRFIEIIPAEGKIVVSTRIEDYEAISDKIIALNGAITLQNLTDSQLQEYLSELPALWDVLKADKDLLEIARTPLLLSLIAYGFRDAPESAQSLKDLSSHELRNKIFRTYIDKCYEHERQRLEVMGQEPPFRLEEIYEVLGHVAMINASGGFRHGGLEVFTVDWGTIHENILLDRDFEEILNTERMYQFIQYAIRLNLLAKIHDELHFIHLRLRDMLVWYYCTEERIFNEKLYTTSIAPCPAKAICKVYPQYGFAICQKLVNSDVAKIMRASAARALEVISTEETVTTLIDVLEHDPDSFVRGSVAESLIRLGDERGLTAILSSDHGLTKLFGGNLRAEAAGKLEKIGTKTALEAVRKWATNFLENYSGSRYIAANELALTLGEIGLITILQSPYDLTDTWGNNKKLDAAKKLEEIGTPTALEAVRKWRESGGK